MKEEVEIMEFRGRDGWIEVISGNMYAGKTEELLRRIRRIEYAKKTILVFKPNSFIILKTVYVDIITIFYRQTILHITSG